MEKLVTDEPEKLSENWIQYGFDNGDRVVWSQAFRVKQVQST